MGKEYERQYTFESWRDKLRAVILAHGAVLKPGSFMVVNIADIMAFPDSSIPSFRAWNPHLQKIPVTKEQIVAILKQNPSLSRRPLAKLLGCSEQTIERRLKGNNSRGRKTTASTKVKLVGHYLEEYATEAWLVLYDHRYWKKDPT